MLISPEYRAIQEKLHERADFGNSSGKWAKPVALIANENEFETIGDYGCGKGDLKAALNHSPYVFEYDPAIEGKQVPLPPCDLVVCTDVLEHIEPDCLEEVLDDLKRCTKKFGFFVVSTIPAEKTLPDGRNAHLIQEGMEFWLPKMWERWHVVRVEWLTGDLMIFVVPKK